MDASKTPQQEMNKGIDGDLAPVGRVRGRSPSTLSTSGRAPPPAVGPLGPGQHQSVARKRGVALRLIAGEPGERVSQGNGVIARFFRTLIGQIVHSRVFQTIDEVCEAVRSFVAR